MRDLRVRTKLLLVLTIPLLAFLGVAGVQAVNSVRHAAQLEDFARQVALGRQINELVHDLQRERDATVGALAALNQGGVRDLTALAPDRTAVDRAMLGLTTAARPLVNDPVFAAAYESARASLSGLASIRDGAQNGWLRAAAVFDAYSRVIGELQELLLAPATVASDPELGQAVRGFVQAAQAKELLAQIRGLLYQVCSAGAFGPGDFEQVTDVRAHEQAAVQQFRGEASAAAVAIWDEAVSGQAGRNVNRLEQTVVDNVRASELGVEAQQWWQASTTQLERLRGAESQLLEVAISAAETRSAEERRSSQTTLALTVLVLLIALLTSLAIGRIMVRSLHSLREQALDVASNTLPAMIERLRTQPAGSHTIPVEPIAIRSADEVGEVADAFTAVHRSAVRLAAEQAMMRHSLNAIHVNLARRSQALVERQLRLLDSLEAAEIDPDQLANLFRLDHLATRMRRNDENLLVLAGGDSDRRWSEPIPLATVVLAAAAEIEQYERVRHDITDNLHIAGHAVADLVHLVAELLENATMFSPPETPVTVLGWATDDGGASLVITDEGIGMTPEALARSNRQIAAPPGTIDVAAVERMGLIVVGHLARRHDVRVELRGGGKGVSVVVELPAPLLAEAPAEPAEIRDLARAPGRGAVASGPGDALAAPATGDQEGAPPRAVPMRAEDVLNRGVADAGSVWWSRNPAAAATGKPAVAATGNQAIGRPAVAAPVAELALAPAPRQRGVATVDAASPAARRPNGLPQRVPMAQLPSDADATTLQRTEADPDEVGHTLSRFYDGVHRAAAEDEDLRAAT